MNISLMRTIDGFIGKQLTRVVGKFTPAAKSLNGDWTPSELPKRVVCTKFMGLGSAVLSLPLLKAMKEAGIKVAFWSFPGSEELLRSTGFVDEVWIIQPKLRQFLPSLWRTWRACRRFKADAFMDLEPTAYFTALLARFSGAKLTIGFMSAKPVRERLFSHLVSLTPERHMVEHAYQMGQRIGLPPRSELELPPPRIVHVPSIGVKKKYVVNVNTSDLSWHRMWPDEHWVSLCRRFLADPNVELIFPGTAGERKRVGRVLSALGSEYDARVKNIAGETNLSQLYQVLATADLVISVDSGIMHLAAWMGTPLVSLFGPETPSLFGPRSNRATAISADLPCSPCLNVAADKVTRCRDNQCMKQIEPAQVFQACLERLSNVKRSAA